LDASRITSTRPDLVPFAASADQNNRVTLSRVRRNMTHIRRAK
jgi:hypothetical protein